MATTLARSLRSTGRGSEAGAALLKVGDLLAGKYRVERILGEGGMGVVVAAHHRLLDQHVAVKLLYQATADREAQSRLLLEARACAKLQSEHVARVIDVDTGADGLPFIVMELLQGADLCEIVDARGALPRWLVVDYVLQTLEGLAHAHARGIVHRDLKPSNLFLASRTDGTQIIKILDFGISKSSEPPFDGAGERRRAMQLTGGRAVLGSPPYMSPEQVRSPKTVDSRTDIWALGIVMYELLTNSMPFGGGEMNETFAQILEREPQPIRQIVNGVPEGLERIVMRCLSKNRQDRFADVSELARALVVYGSGTWMQSADRVLATLSRAAEEPLSGRLGGGGQVSGYPSSPQGALIPSSPARRLDSLQSELTGTARTVARRFSVLGRHAKNLLALSAVISVAALVVFAGTAFQRSRAQAASDSPVAVAGEAPPERTGAPAPMPIGGGGAATSIVTAPVHMAGAEDEIPPAGLPSPTPVPSASANTRRPQVAPLQAAPPARGSTTRNPTSLPVALPRSRDGK